MSAAGIYVLNPSGSSQVANVERARRPRELDGLVVGFLDNTKNNTDRILAGLEEAMKAGYGVTSFMTVKETSNRPADPNLLASMASRCHVLVTGIGD